MISLAARLTNRKSTGFALLLTNAARDGGLREDTIKLLPTLLHPRTSQKHDRTVLAKDWDASLQQCLKDEKAHFEKIMEALIVLQQSEDLTEEERALAIENYNNLLDNAPPQVQLVWDNLNLTTKHRYERTGDNYSDTNKDWMASLWIQDRINANHMDHREGIASKTVDQLTVTDMVPSEKEKDYIFQRLINYFTNRLIRRHPTLFASINSSILPNVPHKFQDAMDRKSREFTGDLYTKSESKVEDLISMMSEVQLNVHQMNVGDEVHCYEKKIVSGDNKTEKNMYYGILRRVVNN